MSLRGRRIVGCKVAAPGSFFTRFLPHSYGYGPANPAKTILAGATFRFDAFCRAGS